MVKDRVCSEGFGFLFAAVSDPALIVDPESERILDANDAACAFLGYDRAEIGTLRAADLHPHELADFRNFARRVMEEKTCRTEELACRCKSGQLVPADILAHYMECDGGVAMLAILRNLRRERLAGLGMGVAKIGHDLRNILASGRLLAERLEAVEDPMTRRVAADLVATVDRAIDVCSATLRAGRAKEPAPEFAVIDLRLLAEGVAQSAGLTGEGAPDWFNDIPEELEAWADRRQLYRVLLNLARNARQVTPADGLITFRAEAAGGTVLLDISDTGPGLPEEIRAQPFSTYARSAIAGGTGLGLVIAEELMRLQGGRLELLQTGREGTTFRLVLRAAP